jgi:hypothetical protein
VVRSQLARNAVEIGSSIITLLFYMKGTACSVVCLFLFFVFNFLWYGWEFFKV